MLKLIEECDAEIVKLLVVIFNSDVNPIDNMPSKKPDKRVNKNTIKGIDLNITAYQYFGGVDLLTIPGVSFSAVLTFMSEIGRDGIKKFDTAKRFASWLRLAANKRISGGKTLSRHILKGSNRLKFALRNAANAVGNIKESDLGRFFNRIAYRKGRHAAITATARKIAVILWHVLRQERTLQA